MLLHPPRSPRTSTLLPYTTPFRSQVRPFESSPEPCRQFVCQRRKNLRPVASALPAEHLGVNQRTDLPIGQRQRRVGIRRDGLSGLKDQRRHPLDQVVRGRGLTRRGPAHRAYGALQIGRHTSELKSLMRISSAVFCLKNKKT